MTAQGISPADAPPATTPLPPPAYVAPPAEKHLDAALLAVVRARALEQSILPGVPFH
jgi:hypothetical protein